MIKVDVTGILHAVARGPGFGAFA